MSILLLAVIYLVFISLGLPDSIIGSTWPSISQSFGIDESLQGALSITASFCTILSSFFTIKLLKYLKERGVITLSILLTCGGLISAGFAPNFIVLCLSMIPLGLGAGAIDSTLNNYVAINYKAIHLNWLHAFWGVGATISPFLISFFLTDLNGWRNGAFCLALIQSAIFVVVLLTLPIWKLVPNNFSARSEDNEGMVDLGFIKTLKLKGVPFALIAFFSYIAIEGLTGSWFASMIVFSLGGSEDVAARWSSYFYLGIMLGRIISGFISLKIDDKNMIRSGEMIVLLGVSLLFMKFNISVMPFAVILIGLGCAPIFPAIIHATPTRFTKAYSQSVMSIQVGFAYIASLAIVPLFGLIGKTFSFDLLPLCILLFLIIMVICNEVTLIKTRHNRILSK